MSNREKLRALIQDVFLLSPDEFRFDLRRDEVETWDSLGVVALAVGVQQIFGYHFSPDEANSITGVQHVMTILSSKGIAFDD
ncbi:hypothetical protein K0B96_03935 [Horticoccus luteus]|uniref:Acyl carrier protein n=1 Tax=Horticoccus luteus TaxID=2862869 RepID=A0A8F9XGZ6_9BACT|nr:acyl carrier protein [Horticoccus luteus]QYM79777.1 hypothetical protein K0B96_03935 [Horticoccus luteus]